MLKKILQAWFGSTGKIVMTLLTLYVYYLSPAVSLKSTDGDTRGWGSVFYVLLYLPLYIFVMSAYVFTSLKGQAAKTRVKGLLGYWFVVGTWGVLYYYLGTASQLFAVIFLVLNLAASVFVYFKSVPVSKASA